MTLILFLFDVSRRSLSGILALTVKLEFLESLGEFLVSISGLEVRVMDILHRLLNLGVIFHSPRKGH